MASFDYDKTERSAIIQFYDVRRSRRTIRLHDVPAGFAQRFHSLVETLNDTQRTGSGLDRNATQFISELADVFYKKLVKVDLLQPREPSEPQPNAAPEEPADIRLGDFLTDYLQRRTDLKKTSLIVFGNAIRNLNEHFGADTLLSDITHGEAIDFGRYLASTKLSRATIDKRMQCACSMFNDAMSHELIERNPFKSWRKKLKSLVGMVNNARQRFISQDDFYRLIEHAPDVEWRLMLALARIG